MMGYPELLDELFAARRLGVRFELERVRRALAELGSPEQRLGSVVLIGGTNGKGSTAAFLESMLRAAGCRTGLFTSPHLARFTERIRVNGVEIEPAALLDQHVRIRQTVRGLAELTFFERTTLLGVAHFAAAGVEVAVLEVGLGGRLDATNALEPDVAVVTGVAYDHTDVLGPTLDRIAREKAGIFRPGRPAVLGEGGLPAGRELLRQLALEVGAAPVLLATLPPLLAAPEPGLPLLGDHQARNAALALAALDQLEQRTGWRVDDPTRRAGLTRVHWPGRLETVAWAPRIILDGAHNPHAAATLAQSLAHLPRRQLRLIVGISADKDAAGILAPLLPLADRVYLTEAPSPRALPVRALAELVAGLGLGPDRYLRQPDPRAALAQARAEADPTDCLLVCGSFFLIGPLRADLLGEPTDPLAVQDPAAGGPRPAWPTGLR